MMSVVPLSTGEILVGMIMYFARAYLIGACIFGVFINARRLNLPGLTGNVGIAMAAMIDGAIICAISVDIFHQSRR